MNPSEWTTDTAKEHLTQLIKEQDRLFTERIDNLEERLEERWQAQDRHLGTVFSYQKDVNVKQNDFRGALEDQAARVEKDMLPRREYETHHSLLEKDVDNLRENTSHEFIEIEKELAAHRLATDKSISDLRQEINTGLALIRSHMSESEVEIRTEISEAPRRLGEQKFRTRLALAGVVATFLYIIVPIVIALIVGHA